ncbi:MAG TPA: GntR family transcriptional regulator [Gaiellaceae bacterium]|nr:GntR family transcriptional regulator [Gaiellaceae bacterium]
MTQVADERRALVDKLAATLQARMLSGELVSGTRLRQAALAEEFGVSRTPIREALRKLQASGLVEVRPHRGALVRAPTAREIRDAYEVRAELEGMAAELAARRIHQDQLDVLHDMQWEFRAALERMIQLRNGDGVDLDPEAETARWGRANDGFHQAIQIGAANDVLVAQLLHLHRSFPRDLTRTVLGESVKLLAENVHEHEEILDAIERRDAAAARDRMARHVRHAGELVTLRFEQRG